VGLPHADLSSLTLLEHASVTQIFKKLTSPTPISAAPISKTPTSPGPTSKTLTSKTSKLKGIDLQDANLEDHFLQELEESFLHDELLNEAWYESLEAMSGEFDMYS